MPIHDWTRVDAHVFRCFYAGWITHLGAALNQGILTREHWALQQRNEQRRSCHPLPGQSKVIIRTPSDPTPVAVVEIVVAENRDLPGSVDEFVGRVHQYREDGINVLLIDVLPPGRHNPCGMHGAIWGALDTRLYAVPAAQPLTLVSYRWGSEEPKAHIEPTAVGRALIDMPVFLSAERFVHVPLEATYMRAFAGMPDFIRDILNAPAQ